MTKLLLHSIPLNPSPLLPSSLYTVMKTEHDIKSAIARSQSHGEVVAVTIEAKDMPEAYAEICAAYDGEVDYTETNEENVYDVWGWTDEQGTDETDFRLLVTIAPSSYDTYQDGNFVETIHENLPYSGRNQV